MSKLYAIYLYTLLFIAYCSSCCNSRDLEDLQYYNSTNNAECVYIYEDSVINYTKCQIIGTIGDVYINKECDISNGYINIGEKSLFSKGLYYVNATIYINIDNKYIYLNIKENKKIYYNRDKT